MSGTKLSTKSIPLAVDFLETIDFSTGAQILRLFDNDSIKAIILETAKQTNNNDNESLIDEWQQTRVGTKQARKVQDMDEFYELYTIPEELSFLDDFDIDILIRCIERLPALTIAYFAANLPKDKSQKLLASVADEKIKNEVLKLLTDFQVCMPHEIQEVVDILKKALANLFQEVYEHDGLEKMIALMDKVSHNQRTELSHYMDASNPEIIRYIGGALPDFMRIVYMEDRDIQLVLARVENDNIALAIHNLKEEITKRIVRNVSKNRRKIIAEAYKAYKSPSTDEIYGAREIIGMTIKDFLNEGMIVLNPDEIH